MKFALGVFWAVVSAAGSAWADEPSSYQAVIDCAESVYNSTPFRELTPLGRWVERNLFPHGPFYGSKVEELNFIKNNPHLAMPIRNASCRAAALSYELCGIDVRTFFQSPQQKEDHDRQKRIWESTVDEETDAIRHFLQSAYLGCGIGRRRGEAYLVAHEGPPPWDASGQMDVYNNSVGLEWAHPRFRRCETGMDDFRMAQAALERVAREELKVLRKGTHLCGDPNVLLQKIRYEGPSRFRDRVNEMHGILSKIWPLQCGNPRPR